MGNGGAGMRTYTIYEKIYPIIGESYEERIGAVEARTEKAALNKATKVYKWDRGGVPARRRKPENFIAR